MKDYFKKCRECRAPTRYPGCQSHCKYYEEGRAALDADKSAYNKKNSVSISISYQIRDSIDKSKRRRGTKK